MKHFILTYITNCTYAKFSGSSWTSFHEFCIIFGIKDSCRTRKLEERAATSDTSQSSDWLEFKQIFSSKILNKLTGTKVFSKILELPFFPGNCFASILSPSFNIFNAWRLSLTWFLWISEHKSVPKHAGQNECRVNHTGTGANGSSVASVSTSILLLKSGIKCITIKAVVIKVSRIIICLIRLLHKLSIATAIIFLQCCTYYVLFRGF